MLNYKIIRSASGKVEKLEVGFGGHRLLSNSTLNKGCAFTEQERVDFGLVGALPERVETLSEQLSRMYLQFAQKDTDLQKNIFLNQLHDTNSVLFYRLVRDHLQEMLPIIYTPTVGDAVEKFSLELRSPRGAYISYPNRKHMSEMLDSRVNEEIDLVVVTDGEGVLGIGDQGIGGMDISIAKLMVYTLCAGISPRRVLPIQLDVGTNNKKLLDDPMYLGWRHERLTGKEYDDFIDEFVTTLRAKFPNIYLHWEDFGRENARKNLNRYRKKMCTFNDDMQGTGMVTLANFMSAVAVTGGEVTKQKVVLLGAGTAGVGIVDQLCDAMVQAGLSREEAQNNFWLVDRFGLLVEGQDLVDFQEPYARSTAEVASWNKSDNGISLAEVVHQVQPTVLIGCSTVQGAFTESIVKDMAQHVARPIIMPLSNPTSRCEAEPKDLIDWTDGKVLMACGSPFAPVEYKGKTIRISQGNNAFIFPGLGLGVIISKAQRMTDAMICVASQALSSCSPTVKDKSAPLLPDFDKVLEVSHKVAMAVAEKAREEGVSGVDANVDFAAEIKRISWEPEYAMFERV